MNQKKKINQIEKMQTKAIEQEYLGVPVTILTGFLGAGKTTLLNYILTKQKGLKTAVLVNEFGEIGIDNDLIVSTEDDMIELSNGCICCSINGALHEAVEGLLEKRKAIDYLVVETTGLADPLPVAMTFLGSELRDKTRLDSIITLIDAENFNDEILHSDVGRSQIMYGDILLINKCDLVNKTVVKKLEHDLSLIKNDARILKSTKGEVPLGLLLSVGLFESDHIEREMNSNSKNHNEHKHEHKHEHEHEHEHEHKTKNNSRNDMHHENEIEGFTSISFQSKNPLSLRKFQNFLDNQMPSEVYRAKGILWFSESNRRHVFHLAGKRFSLNDSEWEGERKNKLVFIGKGLKHEQIKDQLSACIDKTSVEEFI